MSKNNKNAVSAANTEMDFNPIMEMSFYPVKEKGINRITDTVTIAILLAVVFGFTILFFALPDNTFSEVENRSLQQMPEISFDNFISGNLTKEVGEYYADQFPFRDSLVGLKTSFSYAFLRNENKGAVLAKDGYLIQRFDYYGENENSADSTFDSFMSTIAINVEAVNIFYENLKEYGDINLTFLVPPRKVDALQQNLPVSFPTYRHEAFWEKLNNFVNTNTYFSLLETMQNVQNSDSGESIYYKTDHHWTTAGAYSAYVAIADKVGYTPIPKSEFTIETASDKFYGTTWSKAGMKWLKPEIIEYYTQPDEESEYTTEIVNIKTLQGFYDRSKLETKDKYSSFIGGINEHTKIYKNSSTETREKLLFITDSFGCALAPFLARHYDLEVIDMRFYSKNIYEFIKENDIKNIIVMQNMETLSSSPTLRPLIVK